MSEIKLSFSQQTVELLKKLNAVELQVVMEIASELRWELQKRERKFMENK